MRVALIVLGAVLIPTCVYAASLPLDDGDFTKGKCKAGSSDYLESYDIQTANYKPVSGRRILYPQAEGQEGGCYIKKISASGTIYTGYAECEGGGSRIQYSTGTYKFAIKVIDRKSFVSKGVTYTWCAAHR